MAKTTMPFHTKSIFDHLHAAGHSKTGSIDGRARGTGGARAAGGAAARATGYVLGGISPLGQRKRLPTLLDESALGFPTIFVSAGRRGLELELTPADLVRLTDARVAAVASGA